MSSRELINTAPAGATNTVAHTQGAEPSTALAGAISPELGTAAREVLPAPLPGERYHARGLTELWARQLAQEAVNDGREPHTARSYTHAVALWLRYCLLQRIDPLRARRADVDDWISRLGVSGETARLRLAGVSSWYGYLLDNEIATTDPAARAKRPKRTRVDNGSATAYLDDDELNALLAEAGRQAEAAPDERLEIAVRNAALVRVLLTTGVRTGAIQHARLPGDLDQRDGHRLLRYRTKGGARTEKPLVPYAATMLDAYLGLRAARKEVTAADLDGPLFAGCPYRGRPGGKPLTSRYLGDLIRRLARDAGVTKAGIVPHSTRHTVATSLGAHRSLAEVQTYLDHADPRTTRIYLRVNEHLNNSPAYTMAGLIQDHSGGSDLC